MSFRILGLDPSLTSTGWGIVGATGGKLRYVASGEVKTTASEPFAARLSIIFDALTHVITTFAPDVAAAEEVFVNKNPKSTLKLGMARGAVLLAAAQSGLSVHEYTPNQIKKTVVGRGHASKNQVAMMVKVLLPRADLTSSDAADALATAITHYHNAPMLHRRAS